MGLGWVPPFRRRRPRFPQNDRAAYSSAILCIDPSVALVQIFFVPLEASIEENYKRCYIDAWAKQIP